MASFQDPSDMSKCNTCKACFSTIEKVKEHYKSDWHVLNSKRRASGLAPISKQDFKEIKPKLKPKIPQNSKDHKLKPGSSAQSEASAAPSATPPEGQSFSDDASLPDEGHPSDGSNEESEYEDVEDLPVSPTISIFDKREFATMDECVDYMCVEFGFFIPDAEYLVDKPGFLTYLGEKVKLGGVCLYCQKQFAPGIACQSHMKNKSHCKIAYEEGVDMEEFEDFYDFTASYDDFPEGDDDGEIKKLEISSMGELVLLDGRTVGHRAFRRYYKQKFRPEETRPSVLAVQREELLCMGAKFGGSQINPEDMACMSHTELTTMIIRYHKEIRRGQMVEQRGMQKKIWMDQKREYKSKVDAARSSVNTTAKIRDYHKSIM